MATSSICRVGRVYLAVAFMFAASIVLFSTSHAVADNGSFSLPRWQVGLEGGYLFHEGDDQIKGGQEYSAKVGYNFCTRLGLELGVGVMPNLQTRDSSKEPFGTKFSADITYSLTEQKLGFLNPYISLASGVVIYDKSRDDVDSADPYVGMGVGTNYNVNQKFFVRPAYRVVSSTHEWGRIDHEATVTVGYRFGGSVSGEGEGSGDHSAEGVGNIDASKDLEKVYFAFDSSKLSDVAKASLSKNAAWLQKNSAAQVTVAGYCDERGTNEYNMALGQRRAQAAYDYLRSLGVAADRMTTISYGEEFPAEPGHNEAAWSRNRRAEFIIGKK